MSDLESRIDEFVALVISLEPFETLAHLALDFWEVVGTEPKQEVLISQAALEYVAGLYSSLREGEHSNRPPTPDNILRIKELFNKIVLDYILQPKYLSSDEDAIEQHVSVSSLMSSLADRGEGYPHRLWKLFEDRYTLHDRTLLTLLGLTAKQISDIFQFLHSELTRQVEAYYQDFQSTMAEPLRIWRDWKSGRLSDAKMLELSAKIRESETLGTRLAEHARRSRNIAVVDASSLELEFGKDSCDAFLRRFSVPFGEVNREFRKPLGFNELNSTPVIRLRDGRLFIPVPQLLYDTPTRTLYFDLMHDAQYSGDFERINGEFQERRALDSLAKIFGKPKVFSRLRYGDKKQYETDGLVIFDDRIIIVESKSKRLTAQARLGKFEDIVRDFALAVQSSYDQGLRTKSFIRSNSQAEFVADDETKVLIKGEGYARIYIMCVTSESYGPLIINIDRLLTKSKDTAYPWVVSLPDLDLTCDYMPNPYLFFHFLERRLNCYGKVVSGNELDFVANYLINGLYYEAELKNADLVMLAGLASKFDADYLKALGLPYSGPVSPPPTPPGFLQLLQTIQMLDGSGHTSIMLTLLDLDQETRDQIVDMITKTTERTSSDSKMHDFTLVFDDLNLGISFLSIWSREELRKEVVSWGGLKKYKYKKKRWLSLGRAIQDSRFIVNEFCFLNFDWKPDPEADKLLGELKKSGSKMDPNTSVCDNS